MNTIINEMIVHWYLYKIQEIALNEIRAGRVYEGPLDQIEHAMTIFVAKLVDQDEDVYTQFKQLFKMLDDLK